MRGHVWRRRDARPYCCAPKPVGAQRGRFGIDFEVARKYDLRCFDFRRKIGGTL